jgi:tetratricopeptide (TPR) repeat protein
VSVSALAALAFVLASVPQAVRPSDRAGRLAAQAEEASREDRRDDAIRLYREALSLRPRWTDGWWALATLLYDGDAYAEAAAAFRKAVTLKPDFGTAWAMLGLCEFNLARPDAALEHLQRGRRLGISPDPQLRRVVLYHEGMLLLDKREFERAQETLGRLSADGVDDADLTIALGLSVLRLRASELQPGESAQRELVRRAGHAEQLAAQKKFEEALREYEQLTLDSPNTRNVFYALGRYFVATQQPDRAVAAYEREIANSADHVPARLGIAAIKAQTDPAGALPYAEEAVRLNPRIPLGHYWLGSLLLHTPQTERAIAELEEAERSVRDDPAVYYALSRAYARAGRQRDAERARARFKWLTEQRQKAAERAP